MNPQDAQPWADEIGAPEPTTTTRRHLNGDHRSGWCLTRQSNNCTYPPCPHTCHHEGASRRDEI